MTKSRSLALAGLVVLTAVLLIGCGDNSKNNSGSLPTAEPEILTVGSDIPYKPFEFGRPPYKGFDVDLIREIGRRLNLKVRFEQTPFDTIIRDLAQKKFDMAASALTITPQRERVVAFSQPYFIADQALLVKRGGSIRSVANLKGQTIGVQLGSSGTTYTMAHLKGTKVRSFDLIDDAFQALKAGQIDAVVSDFPALKFAEVSNPSLQVVQIINTDELLGFAFPKTSRKLLDKFDDQLTELKRDGTYTRIYRKWFKINPPKKILESVSPPHD